MKGCVTVGWLDDAWMMVGWLLAVWRERVLEARGSYYQEGRRNQMVDGQ